MERPKDSNGIPIHLTDRVEYEWSRGDRTYTASGAVAGFQWSGCSYGKDEVPEPHLTIRVSWTGRTSRYFSAERLTIIAKGAHTPPLHTRAHDEALRSVGA